MTGLVERMSSAALGVAALVIAGVFVHREFFSAPPNTILSHKVGRVAEWRSALAVGRVIGDSAAPIKLIEFADLECPFCRRFNGTVKGILAKYPREVVVVFVQTPIPGHRFAEPAARAAECAYAEGRFASFVDRVFEQQDSLGLKSWVAFGRDAGIADTARFSKCVAQNRTPPIITAAVALAKKLEVDATPTVFLNDWRFGSPPTDSELVAAIEAVRASRSKGPGN